MNISFIGSGNVATILSLAFQKSGHKIINIHSKDFSKAEKLATKLRNCKAVKFIEQINKKTELLFICIQDDEIEGILKKIKDIGEMILVHVSGSVPLDLLKTKTDNSGVFYPLFSFNKELKINLKGIPLCVESDKKVILNILKQLGKELKMKIYEINSEQRMITHISAIFAGNFSNYMYFFAEKLMKKNNLPFKILLPLINETSRKVNKGKPSEMQTGPAKRNDKKLIKKHLEFLKKEKDFSKFYNLLSAGIMKDF